MTIALDKFSTEEINLMSIFDTATRESLRNDLVKALHDVYEPDMIEIFGSTLEKLDNITDEDFAEIGFYIADDDMFTEGDAFGD
ncbi:MAG: transposon-transfer assisting family protein [Defluviitaleaceae bacterium]|nr:transposon-transfer assisting family protein [Defluviitaleaceae bacterium]